MRSPVFVILASLLATSVSAARVHLRAHTAPVNSIATNGTSTDASSSSSSSASASASSAAAVPASSGAETPKRRTLEERLAAKKVNLAKVTQRIDEVKNTVDARNANQRATAEKLWPFFKGAKSARKALTNYFVYTRRAFIAQRNAAFAARQAEAARADADTEGAKAKPHEEIVNSHLDGNDRAKELFARLVAQRKALWTAMHLHQIKRKQEAALNAAIRHLTARINQKNEAQAQKKAAKAQKAKDEQNSAQESDGNTGAEVPQSPDDASTLMENDSMNPIAMQQEQMAEEQAYLAQQQQQQQAYEAGY